MKNRPSFGDWSRSDCHTQPLVPIETVDHLWHPGIELATGTLRLCYKIDYASTLCLRCRGALADWIEVHPMLAAVLAGTVGAVLLTLLLLGRSLRQIEQYERGLIFRFGKVLPETRGPGLTIIRPIGDKLQKVNMQIVAMALPVQEGITRDNVSIAVDGVVYFRVVDPIKAVLNVQNYMFAISQQAQTSLRSIIGQFDMDELLAERDTINRRLREAVGEVAESDWGVRVERAEVKDVSLSEGMKQLLTRQDAADKALRTRAIGADDANQTSTDPDTASNGIPSNSAVLQLQPLQPPFTPNIATEDDGEIWSIA